MSLQYQCPHCKAVLEADESVGGSSVDCPECGKEFVAVPLSTITVEEKPRRPVGFLEAWKRKWLRWSWRGRATRPEFWWAILAHYLEAFVVWGLDACLGTEGVFLGLHYLITFFPELSLTIRRLHDSGNSGKMLWLTVAPTALWLLVGWSTSPFMELFSDLEWFRIFSFACWGTSIIGGLIVLITLLFASEKRANKYGENPF